MSISQTQQLNVESTQNSTTVVPTPGSPFVGYAEVVLQFSAITFTLATEQSSTHTGTVFFEFSPDGTHWDISVGTYYNSTTPFIPRALRIVGKYFRLRYVANDTNLTAFRLKTLLHFYGSDDITRILSQEIRANDPSKVVSAVIFGASEESDLFVKPNARQVDGYIGLDVAVINQADVKLRDGYGTLLSAAASNPTGSETALLVRNIPSGVQQISDGDEVYIITGALSPGNLSLADNTNWNSARVFIRDISVNTSSTNYNVSICQTDDFDATSPTTREVLANGTGNTIIPVSMLNTSETTSLFLKYTDNSGSATAKFFITGVKK